MGTGIDQAAPSCCSCSLLVTRNWPTLAMRWRPKCFASWTSSALPDLGSTSRSASGARTASLTSSGKNRRWCWSSTASCRTQFAESSMTIVPAGTSSLPITGRCSTTKTAFERDPRAALALLVEALGTSPRAIWHATRYRSHAVGPRRSADPWSGSRRVASSGAVRGVSRCPTPIGIHLIEIFERVDEPCRPPVEVVVEPRVEVVAVAEQRRGRAVDHVTGGRRHPTAR